MNRRQRWLAGVVCITLALWGCDGDPDAGGGAAGGAAEGGGAGGAGGDADADAEMGAGGGAGAGGAAGGGEGGGEGGGGGDGGDGGGSEDDCVAACAQFLNCADGVCAAEPDALEVACLGACAANRSFGAVLAGTDNCGDTLAFVAQQSDVVDAACADAPLQVEPLCEAYGVRAAECLVDVCPNAAPVAAGFAASAIDFCNDQVGIGALPRDALVDAQALPCDNPVFGLVDYLLTPGVGDGSGALVPLCEDGPANPFERCEAACDLLEECIPEGTPVEDGGALRDPALCTYFCAAADAIVPPVWACLANSEGCGAVGGCFNDPPPIANTDCSAVVGRVVACTIEVCPPAEQLGADLVEFTDVICQQALANGELAAAEVEAITPQTPCDDPLLATTVRDFTAADPDNPAPLAALCEDGELANPREVCTPACDVLTQCVPPNAPGDIQALRNAPFCRTLCALGANETRPEAWTCASMVTVEMCPQLFACFEDEGPEPPMP